METGTTITIDVTEDGQGKRMDAWLPTQLEHVTRSKIQKLIEAGQIELNEKKVAGKTKLSIGDVIAIVSLPSEPSHLEPKKVDLNILYEDKDLVVINKPPGLVVHPGAGTTAPTLAEGLLYHYGHMASHQDEAGWMRPGIVHRLDKDTSGVMVCAKSELALSSLSQQFADKTNQREYLCLMNGALKEDITVRESYFFRDPHSRLKFRSMEMDEFKEKYQTVEQAPKKFRWAKTMFKKELLFGERLTLATAKLFTGRTHQIRIHSADLKAAILGDQLYSQPVHLPSFFKGEVYDRVRTLPRQMLHGRLLGFKHPRTGEGMQFLAEIPEDFQEIIDLLMPYRTT